MHIPDGFLSPATCAACALVAVPFWLVAWNRMKSALASTHAFQAAMMACFVFLVQMFNVPVPGGTTAHAVGAALVAIICGPWIAIVAVSISLAVQAIVFGDGGIMAYGANVLNMAIVQSLVAWALWRILYGTSTLDSRKSKRRQILAAFIAGYVAIVLGAALTGFELGIQPHLFYDTSGMPSYFPIGLHITLPAMILPHLLIGLVEGSVTAGAVVILSKLPEFSPDANSIGVTRKIRSAPAVAVLLAMVILVPLGVLIPSWAGSGSAWGEWSARETAQLAHMKSIPSGMALLADKWKAPVPDYAFNEPSKATDESWQYMGAALLGIILTGGCFVMLHRARTALNRKGS